MNSRFACPRLLAVTNLVAVLAVAMPIHAAVTITQTDFNPDGHLRILFTDTAGPGTYTLASSDALDPGGEWSLWDAITVTYASPPVFQITVAAPDQPHRFYRVASVSEPDSSAPRIVATDPAQGAQEVPVALEAVRITFDRPMASTVSWAADQQWGGSYATWSTDGRTVEIHRFGAGSALPPATTVRFSLNPNGKGFADRQGKLVAPQSYWFRTGPSEVQGSRVVLSVPGNNAVEVDPLFDTIELHFSEPMMKSGGVESSNWMPWTMSWSVDGRVCYVRRDTAGTPIYGTSVYIRTPSQFFRTAAGVPLEHEYILRFMTAEPPAIRVDANPAKGFFWPYYLLVPPHVERPATLLVEPNNTGTWGDDPWVHESSALGLVRWRGSFAIRLGSPLLVPVFPRPMVPQAPEPGGIYIHALDRYSLSNQWSGLERIDLQMLAMIDDALDRLGALGYGMDRRVFMMGFSASGAFTSRFALLHPDRVKAAAPGSPGGWPLAPVASWEGRALKYSTGIYDLEALTGRPFDLETFRQVALYIYVGSIDTNDALDTRGMTADEKTAICQWLNCGPHVVLAERWPLAQAIYDSVGANAQFVIYPGVAHTITSSMFDDVLAFFRQHR
jgi:pimeloyl-ACP methyl ester carboxylesterase